MAKKRKAGGRDSRPSGPKELDPADARIGPVTTFEDVADSEDEYFINRDKIMLDDEPRSKRQRRDDDLELSDEEVLGYDESDDDEEADMDDEEEEEDPSRKSKKSTSRSKPADEADGEPEGEGDSAWWGSSRKEYYDADRIETEADALEEEAEAKRLQKKKLSKMTEEDFVFDGDEWLAADQEGEDDQDAVVEVLKDVEISEDMGPEERYELLQARYPEFEHLVTEFEELQPTLQKLRESAGAKPGKTLEVLQYRILGCYVATLASYFAILTSPARDSTESQKTIDPAELREHEVMEALVNCRDAWQRVKQMRTLGAEEDEPSGAVDMETLPDDTAGVDAPVKPAKKQRSSKDKAISEKKAKMLAKAKAAEASVADLYDLPLSRGKKSSKQSKLAVQDADADDNSDFGEEAVLDARTAADKAARKKSLKFYTSQIVQKSNRRADAGRDAGGDMDIPHRERLRDRQARLMAEAERRGRKDSRHGAALGDDSDAEDTAAANALRGDEDEYYDMVAHRSKSKKEDKAARYAAYAAASKEDRVVETEEIGEDGKRKITYAIEKNKGLAPKRSKDVRNPRVKKRKQYEAKQKKLRSMKPVWKGGEPKGGYQGEVTGINANVIKSVKL